MSDFVIALPPVPAVPVAGGGGFPVRRIFCVGRNYEAHAKEMGVTVDREAPIAGVGTIALTIGPAE